MATLQKEIKLEGTKTKEVNADQKADDEELMEQSIQMDLVTTQAPDVVPDKSDIQDTPQPAKIELAKTTATQTLADKRSASLAKARAAKAEKAKRLKAEGRDAAEGTPAPDLLHQIQSVFTTKFDAMHQELQDLRNTIGQSAPRIEDNVVTQVHTVSQPGPLNESDIVRHVATRSEDVAVGESVLPQKRAAPTEELQEQKRITSRLQPLFDTFQFVNPQMQQRAAADSTMGGSSSVIADVYF